MKEQLNKIKEDALKKIYEIKNSEKLKELETFYLGRKGELTKILRDLADLSIEEKKIVGQIANEMKKELEEVFNKTWRTLKKEEEKDVFENEWIDVTQPPLDKKELGHLHPITQIQNEIEDIFTSMGFMVLDGPELESEFYNFEALNIPLWHPARDMQDTFFVKSQKSKACPEPAEWVKSQEENRLVMRTQTSSVQVRAMQKYGAPIKAIVPGRCFRSEATDACHEHTFYQIEGLIIDKDISIANLTATVETLLSRVFKRKVETRLRPGYFPFVEPGIELDIKCLICHGVGCPACKHSGWLEILPCGMVHPNVLRYGGIDPEKFTGFAFAVGLDRLVMMRYGINDIRLFQSGDLRFLEQF